MKINNCMKQYIDADYLSKLSVEERRWYIQFLNEYYYVRFKKDNSNHIHKEKRDCNLRNKRIRRDIMYLHYYQTYGGDSLERIDYKKEVDNEET